MTSLAVAGFVALFVATWIFTGFVVSLTGGWRNLGQRYRTDALPPGNARRFQSGRMRASMHYNNALTIGSDGRGLFVAMPAMFRIGHPPLLIPWSEIEAQSTRRLFGNGIRFVFLRVPGVYLEVSERLGQPLLQAAGQKLPG